MAAVKFSSLKRFPIADWFLLPVVFILLGAARGAVLILPFKYYSRLIGRKVAFDLANRELTNQQFKRAVRIGRLIRTVARNTPWQSLCLPQAMVASILLWVYGIGQVTYFGLSRNSENLKAKGLDPLLAHAWVMAGDLPVTGGHGHRHYTVVASFGRTLQAEVQ